MQRIMLITIIATLSITILSVRASAQDWQKTIVIQGDEKPGEPPIFDIDVQPRDRQPLIRRGGDMDSEVRIRLNRERELEEMRLNDPEKFELVSAIDELEKSSKEIAEKYRQGKDTENKEAVKEQLAESLDKLFEMKIQLEELEQKRQEKELAKKKERTEKRKSQKKEIIQLRLDDLLGKNDLLKW
jgi:hypothetical protein